MKKLFIILIIVIFCVSCCCGCTQAESANALPYKKHFIYNGHQYIMFIDGHYESAPCGVVHDPDCKCNKE